MNVVFRVDASIQIGIGHVMRCLSLADEIKRLPSNIYFICRTLNGHLKKLINQKGYEVVLLPDLEIEYKNSGYNSDFEGWLKLFWLQDANETISIVKNDNLDWLIVDHYSIDYRWHEKLKNLSKKIMVIDDLANRKLNCDLLLDQTHGRKFEDYSHLVNNGCELLLGAKYALLRPEFFEYRSDAINKRKEIFSINNILITMGGMDFNNITNRVIKTLFSVNWNQKPTINVVLNELAPNIQSIKALSENSNFKINIIISPDNMAELMLEADLAIGASGSSAWERCSLGLPTLALCTAKNQYEIAQNLQNEGVHFVVDIEDGDQIPLLINQLDELQKNPHMLKSMSDSSFRICDANGVHWVGFKMSPYKTKDGKKLNFRNISSRDSKIIYDWQSNPETRKFAINPEIPSWGDHVIWIDKKINNLLSIYWMLLHDDSPSGVLRLDPIDLEEGKGYLISIFIDPNKYNLGIGKCALEVAKRFFPKSKLYAKILSENKNSISLFTNAGFIFR